MVILAGVVWIITVNHFAAENRKLLALLNEVIDSNTLAHTRNSQLADYFLAQQKLNDAHWAALRLSINKLALASEENGRAGAYIVPPD